MVFKLMLALLSDFCPMQASPLWLVNHHRGQEHRLCSLPLRDPEALQTARNYRGRGGTKSICS